MNKINLLILAAFFTISGCATTRISEADYAKAKQIQIAIDQNVLSRVLMNKALFDLCSNEHNREVCEKHNIIIKKD